MNISTPAAALMKREQIQNIPVLQEILERFLADKGIHAQAAQYLATQPLMTLDALFVHHLIRRVSSPSLAGLFQMCLSMARSTTPRYQGTREENRLIDRSIHESTHSKQSLGAFTWKGASGAYWGNNLHISNPAMCQQRIVIVGAGPSGLMAARALLNAGFTNILVLDKEGLPGGIWRKENLQKGMRANPFPLHFEHVCLDAAPGPGADIFQFVNHIANGTQPLSIHKADVTGIQPGDLCHHIYYRDQLGEHTIQAPIVINAIGVGDPLPPVRPGKMMTNVPPEHAGKRWQETWSETDARSFHQKNIVFVGLSNATLEMVRQIQYYRRHGCDIKYHIITHYPDSALQNPTMRITHQGNRYQLYRDIPSSDLLRVAGDIAATASAFEEARDTGHILAHSISWDLASPQDMIVIDEHGETYQQHFSQLYTLIGYGLKASLLTNMGLSINNPYLGAVDMDYDGELQRPFPTSDMGRGRIWPGYFGLGLRNSFNPNEVLLPGILFRLPEVIVSIVLRAAECVVQQ